MDNYSYIEYAKAVDDFLYKSEETLPDMQKSSERICTMLRISCIESWYTAYSSSYSMGFPLKKVLYSSDNIDRKRVYINQKDTAYSDHITFKIYQIKGDAPWNEDERSRLEAFTSLLFIAVGKSMMDYASYYDNYLGIYNRLYFVKHIGAKLHENDACKYIVCYFNLRGFSSVNLRFGRKTADEIMSKFVHLLQDLLGDETIVARMADDNFAVLFHEDLLDTVHNFLRGKEIVYDEEGGKKVTISAVMGYYRLDEENISEDDVIYKAQIAYKEAKNSHIKTPVFYTDKLIEVTETAKYIENIFYDSLKNEEFMVYYQPKVSLKDYSLIGAEALCRWKHNGEMIYPDKFIPVLEKNGGICDLDFYMLEHVCMAIRKWIDEGREVVKTSFNLSRCHLGNSDLLGNIISIIDKYNIPHEYIEIELTETTTDVSFTDLKKIVTGLQNEGISASVDDFGKGYSSLNLVMELPWNVIKIDKSFLQKIGISDCDLESKSIIMLKHIILLTNDLGIECIVEGVESEEQIALLKDNNCFLAQGYYFDKPLPQEEFEKRLDDHAKGLALIYDDNK